MIQCREDEFINPISKELTISVRLLNTRPKFKEGKGYYILSRLHNRS